MLAAPLEVGLACADIGRMTDFYAAAFGFAEMSRIAAAVTPDRRTALSDGSYLVVRLQSPFGERLKLLCPDAGCMPSPETPVADIIGRRNRMFLTLIVADIDAALAGITAAGGQAMDPPTEIRPGLTIAFARDPEGNVLEIAHHASIAAYRPDLAAERTSP